MKAKQRGFEKIPRHQVISDHQFGGAVDKKYDEVKNDTDEHKNDIDQLCMTIMRWLFLIFSFDLSVVIR